MTRISDRLEIRFDTNEILTMNDNNILQTTKVEPRIMHVLKILMDHSPKVVSREKLIKDVWNDYGGADDALNQSISHLRKLLKDTNKEDRIIETVVKKGYRFTLQAKNSTHHEVKRINTISKWLVLILVILIAVLFFVIFETSVYAPIAPEA